MSKLFPKKALGRTLSRPSQITDDSSNGRSTPNKSDSEIKDETTTDIDAKPEPKGPDEPPAPKPQSAGTISRDQGQKLLGLAVKQEWSSIEPVMKILEKVVAANGENMVLPLIAVCDPVSSFFLFSAIWDL